MISHSFLVKFTEIVQWTLPSLKQLIIKTSPPADFEILSSSSLLKKNEHEMFIFLSEREVQPFILSSEGVVQCLFYRKKSVFVQCFDSSVGFF